MTHIVSRFRPFTARELRQLTDAIEFDEDGYVVKPDMFETVEVDETEEEKEELGDGQ